MKRISFLAVLLLFATMGIFAQSADTTVVVNTHEIKIKESENEIEIKIYELKDGTRVSDEPLYESNYSRKRDHDGRTRHFSYSVGKDKEISTEETCIAIVKSKSRWFNNRLQQPLPKLYFAHLEMTDGFFGHSADGMHQRPSSFEWGHYSSTTIFCTKGGHFGMATGLGISNSYNYFSHDVVFKPEGNNSVVFQPLSEYSLENGGQEFTHAHRSFLRYWSLRLPLTMQLQFNVNHGYLTFSAGAELEWRFGVRSFARYGGSKHTISKDLDYNPIGLNALFQVGYSSVIVFTRMGVTQMFNNQDIMDIYQLSVGIGWNFD